MADRELSAAIAIVGGGPAGCAAALTLRRYLPELAVAVIAMPAAVVPAVGETLSPGVLPLLDYLGLKEDFVRAGHLPAGGTASAWGSDQVFQRNFLFTGRGEGWHLDRSNFDAWLLASAETAGAECIRARATSATREDGRWRIELEGGGSVVADAAIDASGRGAWLARRHGGAPRKDDGLVADVRWYLHGHAERSAEGALVEAVPDGWWYSATLPGGRAVAMFMTDADLRHQAAWEDRLVAAVHTRGRLAGWHATGETAVRAANSQQSCTVIGDGWVAAGDAAAAFDPISSLGIGFSLRSGMEAARVAAEPDEGAAAAYAASIDRIYGEYRERLRGIYQREGRWPEAQFWKWRQTRDR